MSETGRAMTRYNFDLINPARVVIQPGPIGHGETAVLFVET